MALVSGGLFALAFPPYELPLLAPLALVPWLAALALEEKRWRGLVSGILFGLTYWSVSIPWIHYVVTTFGGQSKALGVVSVGLVAAFLAQWPAMVGWATVAFAPVASRRRLAIFPFLWLAAEHARSNVYGGFPWNLTAEALYRHPVWLQSAAWFGSYGVGFLIVSVSALVAAAGIFRSLRALAAAATLVLVAGGLGAARLAKPPDPSAKPVTVALLQPNIPQKARLDDSKDVENYAALLDHIDGAASGRPDLIVVPESAFPVYWETSRTLRRDLTAAVEDCRCAILFNDVDMSSGDERYYNAARLLTPSGLAGPYRKVHLVPFGEYVPLPEIFFFVRQVSTEIGEFSAAEEPAVLASGPWRVGTGVCYEILYPILAWKQVRGGANLLVTISNDSWYGAGGAQAQHFAGAVLRSVENERYLLRAAITGISGIVDEKGRIVAELGPNRQGIVRGGARLFETRTPWTRIGFAFSGLCDAIAVAVVLSGLVRWRRERVPAPGHRTPDTFPPA
jgi:apolipoprotein N-acyltransferase